MVRVMTSSHSNGGEQAASPRPAPCESLSISITGRVPVKSAAFSGEIRAYLKRNLDWFSRFCRAHGQERVQDFG